MEAALAVLGADTTYASQLNAVGRAWFGPRWLGVHAQDVLAPVARDGVGIANAGKAPPAGARIGQRAGSGRSATRSEQCIAFVARD